MSEVIESSQVENFLGVMGFKGHAEGVLIDSNGNALDNNGNLIDSNESEGETK